MNILLIVGALIIFTCIFLNKVSSRLGIPVLLLFILLGVLLGWHDEVSIETTKRAGDICTVALIFIMFYGGFGTNWKSARPVAVESGLLATVGVALTAGIVGVFCHFALGWGWIEGMIMGSVISSRDAATVFSILRTRKMGLKNNTAPMRTFSDFNEHCELSFGKVGIPAGGTWDNTMVKDLVLPEDVKLLMVFRDGQKIITKGNTRLLAGDEVVFCSKSYDNATVADIREHPLSKNSSWTGKRIKDYPNNDGSYVVMIRRGDILYLLNPDSVGS